MLRQLGGAGVRREGRIATDSPEGRRRPSTSSRACRDGGHLRRGRVFKLEWLASFNDDTIASYPLAVWLSGNDQGHYGNYSDQTRQLGPL
jgi:hypothetical protein